MTTGVKTINDLMGLDHTAKLDSCEDQRTKAVTTLWEMAESIGMSTGAVTTATITHATPGATYAHIANRDWEIRCRDAARGAARRAARISRASWSTSLTATASRSPWAAAGPTSCRHAADPEYADKKGKRKDGADLTKAWLDRYPDGGAYVWNLEQFDQLDPAGVDHVLGLFEMSHMQYDHDRPQDKAGEPSLAQMAAKAIDILARNPEGYVLMIEGGRIDHGSHAGNAFRAPSPTPLP